MSDPYSMDGVSGTQGTYQRRGGRDDVALRDQKRGGFRDQENSYQGRGGLLREYARAVGGTRGSITYDRVARTNHAAGGDDHNERQWNDVSSRSDRTNQAAGGDDFDRNNEEALIDLGIFDDSKVTLRRRDPPVREESRREWSDTGAKTLNVTDGLEMSPEKELELFKQSTITNKNVLQPITFLSRSEMSTQDDKMDETLDDQNVVEVRIGDIINTMYSEIGQIDSWLGGMNRVPDERELRDMRRERDSVVNRMERDIVLEIEAREYEWKRKQECWMANLSKEKEEKEQWREMLEEIMSVVGETTSFRRAKDTVISLQSQFAVMQSENARLRADMDMLKAGEEERRRNIRQLPSFQPSLSTVPVTRVDPPATVRSTPQLSPTTLPLPSEYSREERNLSMGTFKPTINENNSDVMGMMIETIRSMGQLNMPINNYNPRNERFAEFLPRFNLKYKGMTNEEKVLVLPSHFDDNTTRVFKSLPERLKSGREWDNMVLEMGRLMDRDKGMDQQWAIEKLSSVDSTRRIHQICRDIEELVNRGMSYLDTKSRDKFMQQQFMMVLKSRVEYGRVLEAYNAGCDTFDDLKRVATEQEFIESQKRLAKKNTQTCLECGGVGHTSRDHQKSSGGLPPRSSHQRNYNGGNGFGRNDDRTLTFYGTRPPFNPIENGKPGPPNGSQTTILPSGGGTNGDSSMTTNGGMNGRTNGNNNQNNVTRPPNNNNKYGGNSSGRKWNDVRRDHNRGQGNNGTNDAGTHSVGMVSADGEHNEGNVTFLGRRLQREMYVEGVRREVTVDSGADVSLIPVNMLRDIVSTNDTEWWRFRDEKMHPVDMNVRVSNASAGPMKIIAQAILTVQRDESDSTHNIGFFVTEDEQNEIILGVNSFESLEINFTMGHTKQINNDNTVVQAKVVKDLLILPGQVTDLSVIGPKSEERLLWSSNELIESGACTLDENGVTTIPILNNTRRRITFKKDDVIGEWSNETFLEEKEVHARVEYIAIEPGSCSKVDRRVRIMKCLNEEKGGEVSPEMRRVIEEYEDVFAVEDSELGKTNVIEHSIETGEARPIKQKQRPVPYSLREPLQKLLNDMESTGVIRPSTSPWSSPVVLVKKRDSSLRLCIDYRKLNEVIKMDAYPMPNITECVQELRGKKIFSTLDLKSGFWQIGLEEKSIEKTAFSTLDTHYEFTKVPFGLSTSPAVFQRSMNIILRSELQKPIKEREVFVYIDDILIATATRDEHVNAMKRVLQLLRSSNMKLNVKKCKLEMVEVNYLGHTINGTGVSMQHEKVRAITEFPVPENVNSLKKFLGMSSFYRKHIKNYAQSANPLYGLTSTKAKWKWGEEQNIAFEEIKQKITSAPVLAQPDHESAMNGTSPFIIMTDASKFGVGAVLAQKGTDGEERPLQFYSRKLTKAEANYGITDMEGLAVYEAVNRFRHFVHGVHTVIRTDHQPLLAMFKRMNVSGRVMRWAQLLQGNNIKMEYVPGSSNRVPDALSRFPVDEVPITDGVPWEGVVNKITVQRADRTKWEQEYRNDKWTREVIRQWSQCTENDRKKWEIIIPDTKEKYVNFNDVKVEESILYIQDIKHLWRIYVPEGLRETVMRDCHEGIGGGHFGSKKQVQTMEKLYYWGSMKLDVPKFVRECQTCFMANPSRVLTPPLVSYETSKPLEIVGIDLIDMGRSTKGNRYILVVIDHFSKYASAYPLRDKSAEVVARTLVQEWILREGRVMHTLLSDRGKEFDNSMMDMVTQLLEVDQLFTLGYNSRRNGVTERMNGTISMLLKKMVLDGKNKGEWDDLLPFVLYAYNTTVHSTTKQSPHFLMYGREAKPISQVFPSGQYNMNDEYEDILREGMSKVYEQVRDEIKKEGNINKKEFDKKAVEETKLPIEGDLVMMRIPSEKLGTRIPKLTNDWKGPYKVTEAGRTSATIVNINDENETHRIQYELLKRAPEYMNNHNIQTKKNRNSRKVNRVSASVESENDYHIFRVGLRCPAHLDYTCETCPEKERVSIRQWIMTKRKNQESFPPNTSVIAATMHLSRQPITQDEIIEGLQTTCVHSLTAITQLPMAIEYEGEKSGRLESIAAGKAIRAVLKMAEEELKKDYIISTNPRFLSYTESHCVLTAPMEDSTPYQSSLSAQLASLLPLNHGRFTVIVNRGIQREEWEASVDIISQLTDLGWTGRIVQSPISAATSKSEYLEINDLLDLMIENDSLIVASHTANLWKEFIPISQAIAADRNTLPEWANWERKSKEPSVTYGYQTSRVPDQRDGGSHTRGQRGTSSIHRGFSGDRGRARGGGGFGGSRGGGFGGPAFRGNMKKSFRGRPY